MRVISRVAVATLAVLLMAGCTAVPEEEAASPSPSATPAATPTPTVDLPVTAFGGECADMLDSAVVTETFGAPAQPTVIPGQPSPPQMLLGGLTCSWRSDVGLLTVVALPAVSVPASLRDAFADTTCGDFPGGGCRGSVSSGDLWMQVQYVPSPVVDRSTEIDVLRGALAASAAAHPGAAPAVADDGWWALPTCEEVSAGIDVAAILGAETVVPEYPADDVLPEEIHPALFAAGVEGWCAWTAVDPDGDDGANLQLYVWPGAAAETQPLLGGDGFAPVEIAGADRASLAERSFPSPNVVYATSGQNAVTIYGWTETANVLAFAEAVMASLAP